MVPCRHPEMALFWVHILASAGLVAHQREIRSPGKTEPRGECTCSGSQNAFDLLVWVHVSELVSGELVSVIKAESSWQFFPL